MITTCHRAAELPADWDRAVGDNLYMRRDFLAFLESCEDCGQRYHYIRDDTGTIDTVFMTHIRRGYNLAMFTPFDLRVKMTFVYVPVSVTRPGIHAGRHRDEALAFIRAIRGYTMILNLPNDDAPGFATGYTCPQCVLNIRWASLDEYLKSLRSGYRRRCQVALRASEGLRLRWLASPEEFDEALYGLYRQVVAHSRLVLETLTIDFFRGHYFRILVLEDAAGPQGFIQLLPNGQELIFEFVGMNYATVPQYDTYQRMLLEIIRYGIDNGFTSIDFGQTADESKLKLGCDYTMLYAALHHSNPLMMAGARLLAPRLQYKPLTTKFHVFKQAGE